MPSRDSGLRSTRTFSNTIMLLTFAIAVLMMLTSSFDIFLAPQIGGTIRFCQLLAPVLITFALFQVAMTRRIPTLGASSLCVWLFLQILSMPAAAFWPKSLAYTLWLALNMMTVFSFVQLFSNHHRQVHMLLRWYLWTFVPVSLFGLVQFTLPILGYGAPLVAQWWIQGIVPRANGFSYEPSYFATYLLIGLVLSGTLRRAASQAMSPMELRTIYWITFAGIIVSSSRIGVMFAVADLVSAKMSSLGKVFRSVASGYLSRSDLKACASFISTACILIIAVAGALHIAARSPWLALLLLNGTGVSDTAAHSVFQRQQAFLDTLHVFSDHPLMGQSLGGISAAIAGLHGDSISSFEDSKSFEGMNVFAEALAGSGLVGIIPFLTFLVTTIVRPLQLAAMLDSPYSSVLRALVRSLIFLWAVLQFNQNLLRPYLWIHLAVLATAYAAAARCRRGESAITRQICS